MATCKKAINIIIYSTGNANLMYHVYWQLTVYFIQPY
jgi:hypothetical protein